MNAKNNIISDEGFNFYNEAKDVVISVSNPLKNSVEGTSTSDLSNQIRLSYDDMDKIAISWIKKRKLERIFGGPVGKEYGAADCEYD